MIRPFRLASVQLNSSSNKPRGADGPVWVQVAAAGEYKGYRGGELPFTLDASTFTAIVSNFRAHPSYVRGPDGYGVADTVPWDFHHASEGTPESVATTGAPAQGWTLDLEVRRGSELWALVRWLPLAKQYIESGQYQWASIALVLDAVDPITGKKIGPVLTSIALTNSPFIEGMQRLVAGKDSSKGKGMQRITPADLQAYPGFNRVEKCQNYLRANVPEAKDWPFAKLNAEAVKLNRTLTVQSFAGAKGTLTTRSGKRVATLDTLPAGDAGVGREHRPSSATQGWDSVTARSVVPRLQSALGKVWESLTDTEQWSLASSLAAGLVSARANPSNRRGDPGARLRQVEVAMRAVLEPVARRGLISEAAIAAFGSWFFDQLEAEPYSERLAQFVDDWAAGPGQPSDLDQAVGALPSMRASAGAARLPAALANADVRPIFDARAGGAISSNRWQAVISQLALDKGVSFTSLPWESRFRLAKQIIGTHRVIWQ